MSTLIQLPRSAARIARVVDLSAQCSDNTQDCQSCIICLMSLGEIVH